MLSRLIVDPMEALSRESNNRRLVRIDSNLDASLSTKSITVVPPDGEIVHFLTPRNKGRVAGGIDLSTTSKSSRTEGMVWGDRRAVICQRDKQLLNSSTLLLAPNEVKQVTITLAINESCLE